MSVRPPTHAGSWYPADPAALRQSTAARLRPDIADAHIIVAPHAGYRYCARVQAAAYSRLAVHHTARLYILAPMHHAHPGPPPDAALATTFATLATPLGDFAVDRVRVAELTAAGLAAPLHAATDAAEHAVEMQLPFLAALLAQQGVPAARWPRLVPLLVPRLSADAAARLGRELGADLDLGSGREPGAEDGSELLPSELAAPTSGPRSGPRSRPRSALIVSTDFVHWGRRFGYTGYVGSAEQLAECCRLGREIPTLTRRSRVSAPSARIWQAVQYLDRHAMAVLARNDPRHWDHYLAVTGATVCGREPLSVLLHALQSATPENGQWQWQWTDYEQSEKVDDMSGSSVSYVAGVVVMPKQT